MIQFTTREMQVLANRGWHAGQDAWYAQPDGKEADRLRPVIEAHTGRGNHQGAPSMTPQTLMTYACLFAIMQSVVTLAVAWVIVSRQDALARRLDAHMARKPQYIEDCEWTRTRYAVEVGAQR